jgi:hypothetical protein
VVGVFCTVWVDSALRRMRMLILASHFTDIR